MPALDTGLHRYDALFMLHQAGSIVTVNRVFRLIFWVGTNRASPIRRQTEPGE